MLSLSEGVTCYLHFHEVELLGVVVEDELDGAGADVIHGLGSRDRLLTKVRPQLRRQAGCGCLGFEPPCEYIQTTADLTTNLLDDLLVPPLNRAIALPQTHAAAQAVRKHLHLDVARALDVLLDEHVRVPERLGRLALRGLERVAELVLGVHDAHALSAAAVHGFDQDGVACMRIRCWCV